jgi:hypothetical protein
MLALLAACHDYALVVREGETGGPPPEAAHWVGGVDTGDAEAGSRSGAVEERADPWEDLDIDAAFDVSYAYGGFGTSDAGGRIEVAFFRPEEGDGSGGGGGQGVTFPEAVGDCAYTEFDLSEEQSDGEISIRGSYEAGDVLELEDDAGTLTLDREEDDGGTLRYRLADGAHGAYPFGRTLDLRGWGGLDGVPPFLVEGMMAIGPDVEQLLPAAEDLDAGVLHQSVSEELEWAWDYLHAIPETAKGPVETTMVFMIRTQRRTDNRTTEALACLPATDGYFVVEAEDLGQLAVDPGDGSTYTMAQLDLYWDGADVATPWGDFVRIRSWMAVSGEVRLAP